METQLQPIGDAVRHRYIGVDLKCQLSINITEIWLCTFFAALYVYIKLQKKVHDHISVINIYLNLHSTLHIYGGDNCENRGVTWQAMIDQGRIIHKN